MIRDIATAANQRTAIFLLLELVWFIWVYLLFKVLGCKNEGFNVQGSGLKEEKLNVRHRPFNATKRPFGLTATTIPRASTVLVILPAGFSPDLVRSTSSSSTRALTPDPASKREI
jgi:hypothetical protein